MSFSQAESPSYAGFIAITIGIGGAVTRSPLPHHRTYGSVYGDSVSKPARAWRFLRLNRWGFHHSTSLCSGFTVPGLI